MQCIFAYTHKQGQVVGLRFLKSIRGKYLKENHKKRFFNFQIHFLIYWFSYKILNFLETELKLGNLTRKGDKLGEPRLSQFLSFFRCISFSTPKRKKITLGRDAYLIDFWQVWLRELNEICYFSFLCIGLKCERGYECGGIMCMLVRCFE